MCYTGVVYARTLGSTTYTFQVSGKLWRNNLIMVDRETGTLWSQVTGRAIDGKHRGAQLEKMAAIQTTWQEWRAVHPGSQVLKKSEDVLESPYQGYFDDPDRMGLFRAQWVADRMPGKTLVYGAAVGSSAIAMTEEAFDGSGLIGSELGGVSFVAFRGPDGGVRAYFTRIDGEDIELVLNHETGGFRDGDGSTWDLANGRCINGPRAGASLKSLAVTPVYWFAWSSFYPNTQVIDGLVR